MLNENTSRKIFVSYKYKDPDVCIAPVSEYIPGKDTGYLYTPRHYVDKIMDTVGREHIYKGEKGDEGMDDLSDDTIYSKLKQKIFDSSVTIVLISPNMWVKAEPERDQWIPKEIAYSLRSSKSIGGRTSTTNAMLAVILPDANESYDYAVSNHYCKYCNSTIWHTERYFYLIRSNMFNKNNKNLKNCSACSMSDIHSGNDHSYMYPVRWDRFIRGYGSYINFVLSLKKREEEFDLKRSHQLI